MIKHTVLWKLREFDTAAERREAVSFIKTGLESLVGVVPGLISAQVGENFTPGAMDLALFAELESKNALDHYQNHPAHLKIKEFVHSAVTQRYACDWEI